MKESYNNFNITKSISTLAILMLVSKILSLIREVAIASFYGATGFTDAYFTAGGFVTNVFFGITAALSTVFIPYYIEIKNKNNRNVVSYLLSSLITSLSFFTLALMMFLYFLAPLIIKLIAPSYEGQVYQKAIIYLRIYSLTILFSLITNMLTALLNAEKRYGYGAIASVVYSITSILCMVVLQKYIGVTALAMSVPLSFLLQTIILMKPIKKYFDYKPVLNFRSQELKQLLVMMIPVLLSNATVEINQLLTRSIATGLNEGSVSILSYSNTLFNFVSTLVNSIIITIFYTELSNAAKTDSGSLFSVRISQAINLIITIIFPIAAITAIFAYDVVKIAYGRGKFSQTSIILTSRCITIYAFAFLSDSIRNLLVKGFYSRNSNITPLLNSIISMIMTVTGSFVLSKIWGIDGIILSICISIIFTTVFLFVSFNKKICNFDSKKLLSTFEKVLVATGFLVIFLLLFNHLLADYSSFIRFFGATIIGFGIYLIILVLLKNEEIKYIFRMCKRK